jgi:hypothetical protein
MAMYLQNMRREYEAVQHAKEAQVRAVKSQWRHGALKMACPSVGAEPSPPALTLYLQPNTHPEPEIAICCTSYDILHQSTWCLCLTAFLQVDEMKALKDRMMMGGAARNRMLVKGGSSFNALVRAMKQVGPKMIPVLYSVRAYTQTPSATNTIKPCVKASSSHGFADTHAYAPIIQHQVLYVSLYAYRSVPSNMWYPIHGSPFLTSVIISLLHISRQPWPETIHGCISRQDCLHLTHFLMHGSLPCLHTTATGG